MKITKKQLKQIIHEAYMSLDPHHSPGVAWKGNPDQDAVSRDIASEVKYPQLLKKIIQLVTETLGPDVNVYDHLTKMAEFYAKSPDFFGHSGDLAEDSEPELAGRPGQDDLVRKTRRQAAARRAQIHGMEK